MTKQTFETTEGLLEDVMRKQAGSIEKAVLEAVMNSVDAGATEIDIKLEEERIIISDDGSGMTKEEIDKYFKKFGLKDSDIEDKEFGKFRMGRGQIFSFGRNIWATKDSVLVVSLDEEQETVMVQGKEHDLDLSGLSYHVLDSDKDVEGCTIEVQLYEKVTDVDSKISDITTLIEYIPWLHDIDLTINGDALDKEFDYDYETEHAFISFGESSWRSNTEVFNKGARVKYEDIIATPSTIVTKDDLDLNFARNDILTGCDVWEAVLDELKEVYVAHLKSKDEFTKLESNWVIKEMKDNEELMASFYEKELIHSASGDTLSLKEMSSKSAVLNKGSDSMARDIERRTGAIVVDERHEELFQSEGVFEKQKDYNEVIEEEMKYEMDSYPESKLGKRARENLLRLRWAIEKFHPFIEVKLGVSKHREVWMVDKDTILVDKDFLKANKDKFATHVLPKVVRHSHYKCDTRSDVRDSSTYMNRVLDSLDQLSDIQLKMLNKHKDVESYVKGQI